MVSPGDLFDANLDHHHHFKCVRCGLTRDFYSDELDNLALPQSAQEFGQIEETLIEVRGVCRRCTAKNAGPEKLEK